MKFFLLISSLLLSQNARLLVVTQEKAKLDAKIKNNDAKIAEGRTEELTEFELKKIEKEKQVVELRERVAKLKEKVNASKCLASLTFKITGESENIFFLHLLKFVMFLLTIFKAYWLQ